MTRPTRSRPVVAVFECNPRGHRLYFARSVLEAVLNIGLKPRLVVPDWMPQRNEFSLHLADLIDLIDIHNVLLPEANSSRFNQYHRVAKCLQHDPHLRTADVIYMPAGDGIAQMTGLVSRLSQRTDLADVMKKTEVLLIGGMHGYAVGRKQLLRDRLSRSALNARAWRRVFHLDPYQFNHLAACDPGSWYLMPDPVDHRAAQDQRHSRQALGIPESAFCLGCAGAIAVPKGIDRLLEAFSRALPRLAANSILFLAGRCDSTIKSLLNTVYRPLVDAGKVIVRDEYLSNEAFADAITAIDVVCLPYRRAYRSSGIFLNAVAANRPLITSNVGWLGRAMELLGLGTSVDVNNNAEFANALCVASTTAWRARFMNNDKRQRFLDFHSHANFQATWTSLLRDEMGMEQASELRNWNWE